MADSVGKVVAAVFGFPFLGIVVGIATGFHTRQCLEGTTCVPTTEAGFNSHAVFVVTVIGWALTGIAVVVGFVRGDI
jgi:LytS/YehU family sensor histidine kinase